MQIIGYNSYQIDCFLGKKITLPFFAHWRGGHVYISCLWETHAQLNIIQECDIIKLIVRFNILFAFPRLRTTCLL